MTTEQRLRTDHLLDHQQDARRDCQLCIEKHGRTQPLGLGRRDCQGSRLIVTATYERTTGSGSWATTVCPVCSRKVGATRPTQRTPWVLVGLHRAAS